MRGTTNKETAAHRKQEHYLLETEVGDATDKMTFDRLLLETMDEVLQVAFEGRSSQQEATAAKTPN
jgi:hypothetical protein